ncbi:DUF2179 domain-containing protein [Desulfobulbus propionicus]
MHVLQPDPVHLDHPLRQPIFFIASIILVFISSTMVDCILSLFNQRKIVYVISGSNEAIARPCNDRFHQEPTSIKAKGAYSDKDKLILMAITNNLELKKPESVVFAIDVHVLFIVENSFNGLARILADEKCTDTRRGPGCFFKLRRVAN